MTDDLPQLVQRLRDKAAQQMEMARLFSNMGRPESDNECGRISTLLTQAADRLDTLTRALAEMTDRARRLGEDSDNRIQRALQSATEAKVALTAMTQERDEAQRNRVEAIVAWDRMQERAVDAEEALTAAVREARAETWASAIGAVEALGESGFFNYAKEQLKAARAGRP